MLFRTAGRRVEVDTDGPLFLRLPFLGEVFREHLEPWYSRRGWVRTNAKEVKALREAQKPRTREYHAELEQQEV